MQPFRTPLSLALGCLLFTSSGLSQDENRLGVLITNRHGLQSTQSSTPLPVIPYQLIPYQFFGDLSVIDSNGIYYRAAGRLAPSVVPPSPVSKLEAYNLDPNFKGPFATLPFSGFPVHLAIGKDNRLFLVVSEPLPPVLSGSNSPVLLTPKSKLFIIPTPFPPGILNVTLESVALMAEESAMVTETSLALTNVVAVDLEGTVNSLQVKAVGDKEYLYTVTSQPPIRVTPSQPPTAPANLPVPVKPSVKLIIFNSDGNKIKEANLE